MADDLNIKVVAIADDSSAAKTQLQSSLQVLVKGTELKLSNVKIESFDISAAITSMKKDLQNQLNEMTITTKIAEKDIKPSFDIDASKLNSTQQTLDRIKSSFESLKTTIDTLPFTIDDLFTSLEKIKTMPAGESQTEAFEQLELSIKQYDLAVKEAAADDKLNLKIERENQTLVKQQNQFNTLSRSLESYISKYSKITKDPELMGQVEEIRLLINTGDVANLEKAREGLKQLKFNAKEAGIETESFGQKLSQVASKYGIFLTLGAAIRQVTSTVKEMVNTVIELDNQLTNLRMITGASSAEIQEMAKGFQSLASELSSTTLEVAKGADTWLRQGKSIEETSELIKATQVFSKIALLDSAQAADLLTSSLNGYGLAASDVMSIIDKMSAIDMAAATSSQELAEAMQRTAASAKIAGISYDEILSYIATVSETSRQSADIIGTAFRSIVSRIQQVKLGKLLDEEGQDIKLVSFAA